MTDALKAYLAKSEPLELDMGAFEAHLKAMTDVVIPTIIADIREGDRLAAELRYAPVSTARKDS